MADVDQCEHGNTFHCLQCDLKFQKYVIEELNEQIVSMKKLIQELNDDNDRLASLNRHYLNFFYQGDVMKMKADFAYLAGDRRF